MDRRMIAKPALVKEYINLFVNRRAFTMQSMRPHPESDRHYYYRPKNRESGAALHLTEKTISDHLEGTITIGLYAINPSNQRCKWVAIDADYKNAMEDPGALCSALPLRVGSRVLLIGDRRTVS